MALNRPALVDALEARRDQESAAADLDRAFLRLEFSLWVLIAMSATTLGIVIAKLL